MGSFGQIRSVFESLGRRALPLVCVLGCTAELPARQPNPAFSTDPDAGSDGPNGEGQAGDAAQNGISDGTNVQGPAGGANPSGGDGDAAQGDPSSRSEGSTSSNGQADSSDAGAPAMDTKSGDPDEDTPPPLCRVEVWCEHGIPNEPKIDCDMRIQDGFENLVYEGFVGIERRGRSSLAYPKRNYGIELRDEAGEDAPVNLLGMGKESDWILDGSWMDRAFVRNELVYYLFGAMAPGRWAPRGRYCQMWLNDDPVGIYRLVERIKRDDDRIDIPEDDGSGQSFLVKQDASGTLDLNAAPEDKFELLYPKKDLATVRQFDAVQKFLDDLETALEEPNPDDPARDPLEYLDLDSTVDWVILQEFAKNIDGFTLSHYLWKAPGELAQPIAWDFDLSMGQPTSRSESQAGSELSSGWIADRTVLIDALVGLPAFQERLLERWTSHRQGVLSEDAVMARIDYALETLTPDAIADNFRIWPIEDVDFSFIHPPYTIYPISSHADEVEHLKRWLSERLVWIDEHIGDYPE